MTLRVHRNPHRLLTFLCSGKKAGEAWKSWKGGLDHMENVALIVGILSFAVTCLAFGYTIGKDSRGDNRGESSRGEGNDKTQK